MRRARYAASVRAKEAQRAARRARYAASVRAEKARLAERRARYAAKAKPELAEKLQKKARKWKKTGKWKKPPRKPRKARKAKRRPRVPAPFPVVAPRTRPWKRTAEGIPPRTPPKIVREIHAAGEVLLDRLLQYRKKLSEEGGLSAEGGPSERWSTFSEQAGGRVGVHRLVPIAMPVLNSTIEEIAYRIMRAAKEVHAALPGGKIYASLYLLEYGRRLAGSPGEMYFDDGAGFFVQSFEGVPGSSLPQFDVRLRRKLDQIVSTDRSAVFMEYAVVRAYQEQVGVGGRPPRRGPKRAKRRRGKR